ncbi:DUF2235 domain-containing protein [Jatrophihabitans sp.]|uniref:DUF2235 domain-containing protein n=1 Tax=Jatrophihabitans sp. TaxID=1932789 RepID=UPI002BF86567|nr:DUF2235 domain-containing protein [Jatrophihabitans sp.]
MAKNVVVCLDGTGNQLKAKGNTNVVKLFQMLDLSDPGRQVAYYDPGVGTFSAGGAWTPWTQRASRLTGLAFGTGLKTNLGEAYTYLLHNFEAGDRLFLFGFSRGAYTARALAGLLNQIGLLRPGTENLIPYAIGVYAQSKDLSDDDWKQLRDFAATFSRRVDGQIAVPVEYLGIWDSVKAAGFLRWGDLHWLWTRQLPNARRIRHAVSIDEKRRPYQEYLVAPRDKPPIPHLEEAWFAGVHSDVGGTFDDDPRLPQISLKWVVDGGLESGLFLRPDAYAQHCTVSDDNAKGTIHRMGRVWGLLTYRRRPLPANAQCHASVRARVAALPDYQRKVPSTVTWADEDWTTASPKA